MQISDKWIGGVLLIALLMVGISCKKDYDVYEVNEVEVTPVNSEKDKPKTDAQYISVLYTNLFQETIGPNKMLEALKAIKSVGDKQGAYDMLVSKYMRDGDVVLPAQNEMVMDPEGFVRDTYERFLVRQPTQAELEWWKNYIDSHPELTPELVYFAFATSNEHFHY